MVHAALTGAQSLQGSLSSIQTLCCSGAILELSMLARVCKSYEHFLSSGNDPAQHRVENGIDVFRIKQSTDKGAYLDFTQPHFRSALQNGCRELEESMRDLLVTALIGKELNVTTEGKRTKVKLDEENLHILLGALFHTSARFYEPGTHLQCQEPVQDLKRSRSGHPKSLKSLHASTVSAQYWVTFADAVVSVVDSSSLSDLLSQALLEDNGFRSTYDKTDFCIRTVFGALMQFAMRGTARPWEMLEWTPGITNNATVREFQPHVVVRSATFDFADRLACSFKRNKHGGIGVEDTGFMEMPQQVGHLLGVFLSIFHSACADFILKVNVHSPGSSTLARLLLSRFFFTTEFSSNSHTYGKWPGNDSTFARCLERLFGLPMNSINLGTFRQVMCAVST